MQRRTVVHIIVPMMDLLCVRVTITITEWLKYFCLILMIVPNDYRAVTKNFLTCWIMACTVSVIEES